MTLLSEELRRAARTLLALTVHLDRLQKITGINSKGLDREIAVDQQNFYAPPEAELGTKKKSASGLMGPTNVGDAIKEIFVFGGKHYVEFLLIGVLLMVPWFVVMGVFLAVAEGQQAPGGLFIGMMVAMIVLLPLTIVGYAATLQFCDIKYREDDRSVDFGKAARDGGSLFVFGLIYMVFATIGLLACILPSFLVMVIFLPGAALIVSEDKGPIEAVQRCWEMGWTHGNGWTTFGIILIMIVINWIFSILAGLIAIPLSFLVSGNIMAEVMVGVVPSLIYMPFTIAYFYIVYVALYSRTEGYLHTAYDDGSFGFGGNPQGRSNPYAQKSMYAPGMAAAGGSTVMRKPDEVGPIDISEYDDDWAGPSAIQHGWSAPDGSLDEPNSPKKDDEDDDWKGSPW